MKKGFKECPFCKNEIKKEAVKCMYCKELLPEEKPEVKHPETKECPFCKNEIKYEAIKCMYCKEMLPKVEEEQEPKHSETKECLFCKNEIEYEATKCPYCEEILDNNVSKFVGYFKGIGRQINEKRLKRQEDVRIEKKEDNVVESVNQLENKIDENKDSNVEEIGEDVKREYSGEPVMFRSRLRIHIYFIFISAVIALYMYYDGAVIGVVIFLAMVFLNVRLRIMRGKSYIKVEKDYFEAFEYFGNPAEPRVIKLKYEDIKSIKFKNSKWTYFVRYFILWGIYIAFKKRDIYDYYLERMLGLIGLATFVFHTIPSLIFRINCSDIEIETNDGKYILPKIEGKKKLMSILEDIKIPYTY